MAIQDVKEQYSEQDWKLREKYYIDSVSLLVVPLQPESRVIGAFNTALDALKAEASLELAYTQRTLDTYTTIMKNAEKEIFVVLKRQQLGGGNAKVTQDELKGLTVEYLKSNCINGLPENIYTIVGTISNRHTFISRVVEILKDKQQALVTLNLLLKIESKV